MEGLELLYRGSLKSCNYRCSYCPFSKHRSSERELARDREQWMHVVRTVEEQAGARQIRALMIVPYGEALLHPWYWEGLARLSALDGIEAVGAQTNLSFPVRESMGIYQSNGGDPGKLHLWGTFHPEMVSVGRFSEACRQVLDEGVRLCAGAVGVPENLEILRELRRELPEELYLWINRMDGLRRSYTSEETEAFLEIDPYFLRELVYVPADPGQCRGRLFVEGRGRVRICNISRDVGSGPDLLGRERETENGPAAGCGRKDCSCYLAYGGRQDVMNRILFGPHPVFRIPRRVRAVFLDLAGTLLTRADDGSESVSSLVQAGLTGLFRDGTLLFFATTLPREEAQKRCREIWPLFSGGIFAGGAHVVLDERVKGERQEQVKRLPERCLEVLNGIRSTCSCRILTYRVQGVLCKVTMLRPARLPWRPEEAESVREHMFGSGIRKIRVFTEGNCLQIVAAGASKAEGVRLLCREIGISPAEAAVAGDSAEDEEMLQICGTAVRV